MFSQEHCCPDKSGGQFDKLEYMTTVYMGSYDRLNIVPEGLSDERLGYLVGELGSDVAFRVK